MTSGILDEFRVYIKKSFKEIVNDIAYEKITSIKNNLQNLNDVRTMNKQTKTKKSSPQKKNCKDFI